MVKKRTTLSAQELATVVTDCRRYIRSQVADPQVELFYIGRTTRPRGRRAEHDADSLVCIFTGSNIEEAKLVEARLIAAFIRHPKNDNSAKDARGATKPGEQCVYLALWFVPPKKPRAAGSRRS